MYILNFRTAVDSECHQFTQQSWRFKYFTVQHIIIINKYIIGRMVIKFFLMRMQ